MQDQIQILPHDSIPGPIIDTNAIEPHVSGGAWCSTTLTPSRGGTAGPALPDASQLRPCLRRSDRSASQTGDRAQEWLRKRLEAPRAVAVDAIPNFLSSPCLGEHGQGPGVRTPGHESPERQGPTSGDLLVDPITHSVSPRYSAWRSHRQTPCSAEDAIGKTKEPVRNHPSRVAHVCVYEGARATASS